MALTGSQLASIKDASNLFLSAPFKLQIDALLPNLRPSQKRSSALDPFLLALHSVLTAIPAIQPIHPLDAHRHLAPVTPVPYVYPCPTRDTNWKVAFTPPARGDILLVGSWPTGLAVKQKDTHLGRPAFVVDVAVAMHPSLFQEKDHFDARFFQKRAFYLAVLAAALTSHPDLAVDAAYECVQGDSRLACLLLAPQPTDAQKDLVKLGTHIRILPTLLHPSPIPLHRLSPAQANLRTLAPPSPRKPTKTTSPTPTLAPRAHPTPTYNTALLLTLHTTARAHLLHAHDLAQRAPAIRDALALLRVWAAQRGFEGGSGWGHAGAGAPSAGDGAGIGRDAAVGGGGSAAGTYYVLGFEGGGRGAWWAALLAALVDGEEDVPAVPRSPNVRQRGRRKPLGTGLSAYQLFRAALDFLAKHDWEHEPVFAKGATGVGDLFPPEEYTAHHDAVLVDAARVNLLAGVPLSSLELLRHNAQKTLQRLDVHTMRLVRLSDHDEGGANSGGTEIGAGTDADADADDHGDPFKAVFLDDQRDLVTHFDTLIRVDLTHARLQTPLARTCAFSGDVSSSPTPSTSTTIPTADTDAVTAAAAAADAGTPARALLRAVARVLRRGLGDHVEALGVLVPPPALREISTTVTAAAGNDADNTKKAGAGVADAGGLGHTRKAAGKTPGSPAKRRRVERGAGVAAPASAVAPAPAHALAPSARLTEEPVTTKMEVYIGLVHHAQHALRLVDHGPPAVDAAATASEAKTGTTVTATTDAALPTDPPTAAAAQVPAQTTDAKTDAARFHALWGAKAELRRFKDGRISECVVWWDESAAAASGGGPTPEDRARIPATIVQHLLAMHFGVGAEGDTMKVDTPKGGVKNSPIGANKVSVLLPGPFDRVLRLPAPIMALYHARGVDTGYKAALRAFEELARHVRALGGGGSITKNKSRDGNKDATTLPLSVASISPASAHLRYTSACEPVPVPASLLPALPAGARFLAPMAVVLAFERSTMWPDDLGAMRAVMLALLERLADGLMHCMRGARAVVVLGAPSRRNGVLAPSDIRDGDGAYLEVVTPAGWAFILRIWHDREATLLARLADGGLAPHIKRPPTSGGGAGAGGDAPSLLLRRAAQRALERHTRRFVHAPRHHRAVAALCHRFGAYAGTVRLVKRWFGVHWLLRGRGAGDEDLVCEREEDDGLEEGGAGAGVPGTVSEETVEVLCARIFVGEGHGGSGDVGAGVPRSKERGFCSVVRFLSEWRWDQGPLYVPLFGGVEDGSGDAVAGAPSGPLPQLPSSLPSSLGCWRLSTDMDRDGRVWTGQGPDVLVANRVQALAKATWELLKGVSGQDHIPVQQILTHPMDDYDVTLQLDATALPRYAQNVRPDAAVLARLPASSDADTSLSALRVGFDPAAMLFGDLRRIYAGTLRFFYDPAGGDTFGAVWDTHVVTPRVFRVLNGFSSLPQTKPKDKKNKQKNVVVLNRQAVLSEIGRLGLGLLAEIRFPGNEIAVNSS